MIVNCALLIYNLCRQTREVCLLYSLEKAWRQTPPQLNGVECLSSEPGCRLRPPRFTSIVSEPVPVTSATTRILIDHFYSGLLGVIGKLMPRSALGYAVLFCVSPLKKPACRSVVLQTQIHDNSEVVYGKKVIASKPALWHCRVGQPHSVFCEEALETKSPY